MDKSRLEQAEQYIDRIKMAQELQPGVVEFVTAIESEWFLTAKLYRMVDLLVLYGQRSEHKWHQLRNALCKHAYNQEQLIDFLRRDAERSTIKPDKYQMMGIIRDIIGNVVRPAILSPIAVSFHVEHQGEPLRSGATERIQIKPEWVTRDVYGIARTIYDKAREKQTAGGNADHEPLDQGLIGLLRDALFDARMDSEWVEEHLSRSVHYKGCWVIDCILGYPETTGEQPRGLVYDSFFLSQGDG